MNEDRPSSISRKENQKRQISWILFCIFATSTFFFSALNIWQRNRTRLLAPGLQVGDAQELLTATLIFKKNYDQQTERKGGHAMDHPTVALLKTLLKSNEARQLSGVIQPTDQRKKIKELDWFWDDLLKKSAKNGLRASTLYDRFENSIEKLCLADQVESSYVETETILPFEKVLNFGEVTVQFVDLVPPPHIDVDEPTPQEIESLYAQEIDTQHRAPSTYRISHTQLLSKIESCPRPEPITEQEARDYLSKHPEDFVRPSKRCFKYRKIEHGGFSNTHRQWSHEDFLHPLAKVECLSNQQLPGDFSEKLFQMKPGDIAEGMRYQENLYAIQYLFEIPSAQNSIEENLPLAYLKAYQAKVDEAAQKLNRHLRLLPSTSPKLNEETLDRFCEHFKIKLDWEISPEAQSIDQLSHLLENNEFDPASINQLRRLSDKALELKIDEKADAIYLLNHQQNLLIRLDQFKPSRTQPISEIKDQLIQKVKRIKITEKIDQWTHDQAKKIIAYEKAGHATQGQGRSKVFDEETRALILQEEFQFSEERRLTLEPLESLTARLHELQESSSFEASSAIREIKILRFLSTLPIPTPGHPVYAILPSDHHPKGFYQLIKVIEKSEGSDLKGSLEEETKALQLNFWKHQKNEQMRAMLPLALLKGESLDELNQTEDEALKSIKNFQL